MVVGKFCGGGNPDRDANAVLCFIISDEELKIGPHNYALSQVSPPPPTWWFVDEIWDLSWGTSKIEWKMSLFYFKIWYRGTSYYHLIHYNVTMLDFQMFWSYFSYLLDIPTYLAFFVCICMV